jgi:regulator of protease activity HflC (stomatin/prohibitin superfamily)
MKKLMVLVTLLAMTGCGFEIVDTGFRGVETRFGKVASESLPEGLYFYNPFTSDIIEMNVQEQKWSEKTECFTKDTQTANIQFMLNYYPDPSKMHLFFEKLGRKWDDIIVPPIVFGRMKQVTGTFHAVEMVTQRESVTKHMRDIIEKDLAEKNIILKNFQITDISLDQAFIKAVESKVVAIQEAEQSKNITVRIQEEANQKVIAARAEAESMRIRANALSQNKALIEWNAIEKWSGVLPNVLIMGKGGAGTILNIPVEAMKSTEKGE